MSYTKKIHYMFKDNIRVGARCNSFTHRHIRATDNIRKVTCNRCIAGVTGRTTNKEIFNKHLREDIEKLKEFMEWGKYSKNNAIIIILALLVLPILPATQAYTTTNGQLNATIYESYNAYTTTNGQLNASIEIVPIGYFKPTNNAINLTIGAIFKWDTIISGTTTTSTTTTTTTIIPEPPTTSFLKNPFTPLIANTQNIGKILINFIED